MKKPKIKNFKSKPSRYFKYHIHSPNLIKILEILSQIHSIYRLKIKTQIHLKHIHLSNHELGKMSWIMAD